jgi:hypothetical protein
VCLLFSFLVTTGTSRAQYSSISFYVVAHPDDWELFMGVNAFRDIGAAPDSGRRKIVIIYTTAGESNCNGNGKAPDKGFYFSRQDGANHAIQFCSDIYSPHSKWLDTTITINGSTAHNIAARQYKNVNSYYMRLPDGCWEAKAGTLSKLCSGTIDSLQAIDRSTTYHGHEDLVLTVRNIVQRESADISSISIHASEWDSSINPRDHPDHVATGKLVTALTQAIPCATLMLFEGYNTCAKPANLTPAEIAMEASLESHASYCKAAAGYGSDWDPESACGHVSWTSRNYYRSYNSCDTLMGKQNALHIFSDPPNNLVNITYTVPENGPVTISVYDAAGKMLAAIVNEHRSPGIYTAAYHTELLPKGDYVLCYKMPKKIKIAAFEKR